MEQRTLEPQVPALAIRCTGAFRRACVAALKVGTVVRWAEFEKEILENGDSM